MRNVLVPTEPHDVMHSVLETALLVQARFGSHLEGFSLRPAIPDYVPIDMVSGLAWHVDEKADEDTRRDAHRLFDAAMAGRAAPGGWGWHAKAPAGDAFLAGHARAFDLVILGRPVTGKAQPSMASLEAVLFESGRPLLIAPPAPPASVGEHVVIAWNRSTETARTLALSMPFLHAAKAVTILELENWGVTGPSGDQLATTLGRNGIAARTVTAPRGKGAGGEAILEETARLGGDLLVKGAYTQSRLRQMIFGGATAHILAATTLPVLMAN